MQITFDKKTMIVTHSTGHVDRYTVEYLQAEKTRREQDRDRLQAEIVEFDFNLSLAQAS